MSWVNFSTGYNTDMGLFVMLVHNLFVSGYVSTHCICTVDDYLNHVWAALVSVI